MMYLDTAEKTGAFGIVSTIPKHIASRNIEDTSIAALSEGFVLSPLCDGNPFLFVYGTVGRRERKPVCPRGTIAWQLTPIPVI